MAPPPSEGPASKKDPGPSRPRNVYILSNVLDIGPTDVEHASNGFPTQTVRSLTGENVKTAQASLTKNGAKVTLGDYGTYTELLAPAVMLCRAADSALLEEEVRSDVLAEKPNGDSLALSYARYKICSKTLETPTLPLGDDARQLRRVLESPEEAHHVVILTSWGSMLSGQDFLSMIGFKSKKNLKISIAYPKSSSCRDSFTLPADDPEITKTEVGKYEGAGVGNTAFEEIATATGGSTIDLCASDWQAFWKAVGK